MLGDFLPNLRRTNYNVEYRLAGFVNPDHGGESGQDSPVAHHLDEPRGLQMQKDVWDDISSAQHALQAVSLQDAVQLWQEGEHMVDEPETFKIKLQLQ